MLTTLGKSDTPWAGQVERVREWYKPHFDRIYDANPSREKDIEQLALMAGTFQSRERFLSDLALNPPDVTSDKSENPFLDEDYIVLSTIHSAKGREWKVVFILNVADGWIPSDMATEDEEQIEEERRLLYVAMTRAKDHLHLSWPSRFYANGFNHVRADRNMYALRSRFIPDSILPHFKRGVFGRDNGNHAADTGQVLQPVNVAEQVVGMWN